MTVALSIDPARFFEEHLRRPALTAAATATGIATMTPAPEIEVAIP